MSSKKPKKWTEVYPQGCKQGDEELKFFKALARHPKYTWRSVDAIAKESGLTIERVEEIIEKYEKKGMVLQSPKNSVNWGYWERNQDDMESEDESLTNADQNERIDKALNPSIVKTPKGGGKIGNIQQGMHQALVKTQVMGKYEVTHHPDGSATVQEMSIQDIIKRHEQAILN